jgi:cell wall-associated NlpC family hydrolase
VLALILSLSIAMGVPSHAVAVPTNDRREQAVRVKAQIDALDEKVEIASEDYNEANDRYQAVTAKVKKATGRLKTLTAQQKTLQGHLETRAGGMYRQGPLGFLEILLGARSFEAFSTTWDFLKGLNEQDARTVASLKTTRTEVAKTSADLKKSQAEAKSELDVMAKRKASIEKQLAERERLLKGIESEIARLEAAAEAVARASRYTPPSKEDYGDPGTEPRSEVVAIAKSKLGAPYRWAAAGPDAFDCSGFTMWVYAQVGVSLPHSSRAQINSGPRVSRANLKPGDLVFFGRGGIHHVGMYVGGGMYIHSPRTGDVVKISSLDRGDYVGACRP